MCLTILQNKGFFWNYHARWADNIVERYSSTARPSQEKKRKHESVRGTTLGTKRIHYLYPFLSQTFRILIFLSCLSIYRQETPKLLGKPTFALRGCTLRNARASTLLQSTQWTDQSDLYVKYDLAQNRNCVRTPKKWNLMLIVSVQTGFWDKFTFYAPSFLAVQAVIYSLNWLVYAGKAGRVRKKAKRTWYKKRDEWWRRRARIG